MLFQGGDQGGLEDDFGEQRTNKPHSGQTNHKRRPGAAGPDPSARIGSPHPTLSQTSAPTVSIHSRLQMQKWHVGK